jgi:DNA-binding MarR family transcriptional regulator
LYDDALRPYGIKSTQFNILVAIAAKGPLSPGRLGSALALEKSTVSRSVETMSRQGWLRTLEGGGRSTLIVASPQGLSLLEEAFPAWQAAQDKACKLLGEPGVVALQTAVRTLAK